MVAVSTLAGLVDDPGSTWATRRDGMGPATGSCVPCSAVSTACKSTSGTHQAWIQVDVFVSGLGQQQLDSCKSPDQHWPAPLRGTNSSH